MRPRLANRYFALRHGRSRANACGLIVSGSSVTESAFGLTRTGRDQVRQSVAACSALGPTTLLLSSPLLRARQSAAIAQRLLGCAAPTIDPRLRERGFGALDGMSDQNYRTVWERDAEDRDPTIPGVEPLGSVRARVAELLDELERRHASRCILLVGHGDPLQILWTVFAGVPASQHRRMPPLETGQVVDLIYDSNQAGTTMPTEAEMKAVMTRYVELVNAGDVTGVVALFAENATVEDPVGTPVRSGRSQLTRFYEDAVARGCVMKVLSGPHGSFGNCAGMAAEVEVTLPGQGRCRIPLVEIQAFDEHCRITSMRAYWGNEDVHIA